MEHRSTMPSGIGLALKQQRDTLGIDKNMESKGVAPPSVRGDHGRPMADERMSEWLVHELDVTDKIPTTDIDDIHGYEPSKASPTKDSVFKAFCTGHPPRRSFLNTATGAPPRLPTFRRSTLADKPELDTLLKVLTIQFRNEVFLPIDENTVRRLTQYTNGSKPLACTCRFERLLINTNTSKVHVSVFVKVLESIGMYCKHLAIVAPFHPIELGNAFECEVGNSEPGTDWEKIIDCLPNLDALTFDHPGQEVTRVTRDSFYTLDRALRTDTNIQKIIDLRLCVPPKVCFKYHKDHHSGPGSSPLCLVGADMVYADGPDFGSLDNSPVFGKAEDIKPRSSDPAMGAT